MPATVAVPPSSTDLRENSVMRNLPSARLGARRRDDGASVPRLPSQFSLRSAAPSAGRLVDADHMPAVADARAVEALEAGEREVRDVEGQRVLGRQLERLRERGLDGPAVRDGDDVASGVFLVEPPDGAADAAHEIHEALAAR